MSGSETPPPGHRAGRPYAGGGSFLESGGIWDGAGQTAQRSASTQSSASFQRQEISASNATRRSADGEAEEHFASFARTLLPSLSITPLSTRETTSSSSHRTVSASRGTLQQSFTQSNSFQRQESASHNNAARRSTSEQAEEPVESSTPTAQPPLSTTPRSSRETTSSSSSRTVSGRSTSQQSFAQSNSFQRRESGSYNNATRRSTSEQAEETVESSTPTVQPPRSTTPRSTLETTSSSSPGTMSGRRTPLPNLVQPQPDRPSAGGGSFPEPAGIRAGAGQTAQQSASTQSSVSFQRQESSASNAARRSAGEEAEEPIASFARTVQPPLSTTPRPTLETTPPSSHGTMSGRHTPEIAQPRSGRPHVGGSLSPEPARGRREDEGHSGEQHASSTESNSATRLQENSYAATSGGQFGEQQLSSTESNSATRLQENSYAATSGGHSGEQHASSTESNSATRLQENSYAATSGGQFGEQRSSSTESNSATRRRDSEVNESFQRSHESSGPPDPGLTESMSTTNWMNFVIVARPDIFTNPAFQKAIKDVAQSSVNEVKDEMKQAMELVIEQAMALVIEQAKFMLEHAMKIVSSRSEKFVQNKMETLIKTAANAGAFYGLGGLEVMNLEQRRYYNAFAPYIKATPMPEEMD
ncbi:hypothetical protein C8R44DRAFT_755498 [Mycena epipterygia]|nr:hypothetical protein C8R44DRAFT_755498 [Mycena epipterygia]